MNRFLLGISLGFLATTFAAAQETDPCVSRWSLAGIFPGMSSTDLQAKFPEFPVSRRRSEATAVTAVLVIGDRSLETKIGVCLDKAGEVSLVRVDFLPGQIDHKAVREWLAMQYGTPLSLGILDSVSTGGEWVGHRSDVVFDSCTRHGFISSASGSRGASTMSFAIVSGLPPYLTTEADGGIRIDDDRLEEVAWKYARCRK